MTYFSVNQSQTSVKSQIEVEESLWHVGQFYS